MTRKVSNFRGFYSHFPEDNTSADRSHEVQYVKGG